ncbi:hypothetical protein OF83DRAFT_457635 [Amylostereum chailletii]|nr:hypothetical protein OF83DRAFT_457635 [Amylostereum chailletii]
MSAARARCLTEPEDAINAGLSWKDFQKEAEALKEVLALVERCSAVVHPSTRLPPEILLEIFFATRDVYPQRLVQNEENSSRYNLTTYDIGWIRLTHVCRNWRTLALNTASLWTRIEFTAMSKTCASRMIERSQDKPLSLKLLVANDRCLPFYLEPKPQFPISSLEIMYHHWFQPSGEPFSTPITMDIPTLTSLTLVDDPNFTRLPIRAMDQLTHVRIAYTSHASYFPSPTRSNLNLFLEKITNAREIVFENMRLAGPVTGVDPERIRIPSSLERVVICADKRHRRASESAYFATQIVLPPSATLAVDLPSDKLRDYVVSDHLSDCVSEHAGASHPPHALSFRFVAQDADSSIIAVSIGIWASPWPSSSTPTPVARNVIPTPSRFFRWSTDWAAAPSQHDVHVDPVLYRVHLSEVVDLCLDVQPSQSRRAWEMLFREMTDVRRICTVEDTLSEILPLLGAPRSGEPEEAGCLLPNLEALCINYLPPGMGDHCVEADDVGGLAALVRCLQARRELGFGLREVRVLEVCKEESWVEDLRKVVPFVGFSRQGCY